MCLGLPHELSALAGPGELVYDLQRCLPVGSGGSEVVGSPGSPSFLGSRSFLLESYLNPYEIQVILLES